MSLVFEGSALASLADDAVLECGVCWHVYEPAEGDPVWNVPAGVPFSALPEEWRCPACDAPRSKFMVKEAGAGAPAAPRAPAGVEARVAALASAYRGAERAMIGLPVHNPSLEVETVGFRPHGDGYAGVAITPWCMNVVFLDARPDAPPPGAIGSKRKLVFPSGAYEFILGRMDGVGLMETCSLFSPMDEFADMEAARLAAEAAVEGLFTPEEPEAVAPKPVSRRFVLTRNGAPA